MISYFDVELFLIGNYFFNGLIFVLVFLLSKNYFEKRKYYRTWISFWFSTAVINYLSVLTLITFGAIIYIRDRTIWYLFLICGIFASISLIIFIASIIFYIKYLSDFQNTVQGNNSKS